MGLRILRVFFLAVLGASSLALVTAYPRTAAVAFEPIAMQETPEPTDTPTATPSSEPALIMHSSSEHTESSSESSSSSFSIGTSTPSPSGSPSPSPTPNPWRQITVATKTLAPSSEGSIQVLGSFAAARRDGTSAVACISFKNADPRTATRVLFDFGLIDGNGANVGSLTLDRKGTFSTGIDIVGYGNLSDFASHSGNRGYADNCTSLSMQMAALPLLSARYATYSVKRVEYADGSSWDAPASP